MGYIVSFEFRVSEFLSGEFQVLEKGGEGLVEVGVTGRVQVKGVLVEGGLGGAGFIAGRGCPTR